MAKARLEVVFSQGAASDLESIYLWVYNLSANPATAFDYVERIRATCLGIGEFPDSGRARNDLFPGVRLRAFERRAVIAYVVTDVVTITNVFHGGRDWETLLRGSKDWRTPLP